MVKGCEEFAGSIHNAIQKMKRLTIEVIGMSVSQMRWPGYYSGKDD